MAEINSMQQDNRTQNKIVQTYAEDMAKVIEDDKGGLIKKIIHGEEEHEIEKEQYSPESKKNKLFMFTSLTLTLTAFAILLFFFFRNEIYTVEPEKQFVPIIFNDQSAFFEVKGFSKNEIVQTILNEVNTTQVKNGGVEGIYLTFDKRIIRLRRFMELIKADFPPDNFVNDNFLLGVVNNDTNDFFMLLKVRSLADVFDSWRAWENKMFLDLHDFFGFNISPETKYLLTKNFEDNIVQNKNARILYDKDGKTVMMYIFADDTSVIITQTENATHEIMLRLASSQIKK
ncbi:MAG: hypothetical protein G01um101424_146 [Parcubacteria group bacterium Gr01-1014_24]|nr:MAG: hypothetical protein G01um101424_146 [Parcubacteria group bacterium Gr01-1014_24]